LAALIERSLGSPESFQILSNRYRLLQIAQEEGLRVPAMEVVNNLAGLRPWKQDNGMPLVLKIDGTWGGSGVKIVATLRAAQLSFLELAHVQGVMQTVKQLVMQRDWSWALPRRSGPRSGVLAQAYIRGRPANCAVVCWEGRLLDGIGVEVLNTSQAKGPSTVVRVIDSPEMMLAAERIAARLHLSGFFGLDFMIEEGSGAAYLIEMNPRCTQQSHLQLGEGRDLVEALCAQLSGRPCQVLPPVTESDVIAFFPHARHHGSQWIGSCFEDIPQGEPELVEELLHPWCERSMVGRIVDQLRRLANRGKASKACVFETAVVEADEAKQSSKLQDPNSKKLSELVGSALSAKSAG
jgi:hypothetical protein